MSPVHKTRRTKAEEEKVKKRKKERKVREVEPAAASCNFCSDFRFHGQEKHGYCSVLISGRCLGFPCEIGEVQLYSRIFAVLLEMVCHDGWTSD